MRRPLQEEQGRRESERGHRQELHVYLVCEESLPDNVTEDHRHDIYYCAMAMNHNEHDGGDLIYLEIGCAFLQRTSQGCHSVGRYCRHCYNQIPKADLQGTYCHLLSIGNGTSHLNLPLYLHIR